MRRHAGVAWSGLLLLWMAGAGSTPAWALGSEIDTLRGIGAKLVRGVANTATGWVEIPKQITLTWQENGPGPACSWGLVKGIGFAVARTAVGAYEIVTFPAPLPDGYRPILDPEYVFADFKIDNQQAQP